MPPIGLSVLTDVPALGNAAQTARGAALSNASPEQNDAWWFHPQEIDGVRWNQNFPYQLFVVRRNDDGGWDRVKGWGFILPIPPESYIVTTPVAHPVHVTLGGIVETRGGAPLRQIQLTGTTGVHPLRSGAKQRGEATPLETIFGGTIAAARATGAAAADLAGVSPALNVMDEQELSDINRGSGFYQFRLFTKFLEDWLAFSRTEDGADCALAFAAWKDEAVYLVVPGRWAFRKASDAPLEYRYQLDLTAFRRIDLDGGPGPLLPEGLPSRRDPNFLTEVLDKIEDARKVLEGARATVAAVAGDVDRTLFEPLRELALLTKDALGVPLALVDLPAAIVRDLRDTVILLFATGQDVANFGDTLSKEASRKNSQIASDLEAIRALGSEIQDRTTVASGVGTPTTAVRHSNTDLVRQQRPATDVFDSPADHPALFRAIPLAKLRVPPRVSRLIREESSRVRALSRADIQSRRTTVLAAAAAYESAIGAGDPTVARVFGRPAPAAARPLSRDGFRVAAALNAAGVAAAQLSVFGRDTAEAARRIGLEQTAARAKAAAIPFRVPRSKFPIPFPYGATLEALALRYLGDPNRWHEIAALNGLRSPYVDEIGVDRPLLVPGAGNRILVADDPDLFVGQVVRVSAIDAPRTRRRVVGIDRRDGTAALTLDGDADLAQYSTLNGAVAHTFRPGTTNSQSLVYIPSDRAPDGSFRVTGVADATVHDPLASVGGIDLLLTPQNDLIVTQDGDGRWAVGITNLVQGFRILTGVKRGALLRHEGYGLGIRPGTSTADLTAADYAKAVRTALAADPAYSAIRTVHVEKTGAAARISVQAEVTGTDITLPLSVDAVG